MMNTLSLYGSHDAGAVFVDYTGKLKILEYERFVQKDMRCTLICLIQEKKT